MTQDVHDGFFLLWWVLGNNRILRIRSVVAATDIKFSATESMLISDRLSVLRDTLFPLYGRRAKSIIYYQSGPNKRFDQLVFSEKKRIMKAEK